MKSKLNFFIQMPFTEFVANFPKIGEKLRQDPDFDTFFSDPLYVVRFNESRFEIGYSDDDWFIN